MILLTHTLTGVVIGTKISSPYLVVIISFLSHIILDSIPHVNLPFPKKADPLQILKTLLDVIPSISIYFLFLYFFPQAWINITLLIPRFNRLFAKFYDFHEKIQRKDRLIIGVGIYKPLKNPQ